MSGGHIVLGTTGSDLFEAVITAEAAIEGAAAWSVICWLIPERSGTEQLVRQETAYEIQRMFEASAQRWADGPMTIQYIDPKHALWHLHSYWCECWTCLAFEDGAS